MFRVKRLYSFVLEAFLPLLLLTFGVCLFILLMQFLWKYVNDMVGKGIDMIILSKMFFYAAISFIPQTLPLAVLLASLMTFGNLGERLELLAIKSAGVSLFRITRPLVISLVFIAGISFYFQNNIVPVSQSKLWTIVLSIKQKSPELDIPEGSFCKEISGYNVYVRHRHKDRNNGMMYDMMIYDLSKGFENATVIVADSGKLKVSDDKFYLVLTLYNGESFENYINKDRRRAPNEKVPYRRETFSLKEILIVYDTNFNMADESIMKNRDMSKDMQKLIQFVDSAQAYADSVCLATEGTFVNKVYGNTFKQSSVKETPPKPDQDTTVIGNWDDYFADKEPTVQKEMIEQAKSRVESMKNDYVFEVFQQSERLLKIRGHNIEIQKRFSLALACLIFFFIGAPLGAIIRKGGLGMPAVLSVFLFLFYYTIDIFGLKMARQGVWSVWQGVWLSTFVLSALGSFLTYKAVNDSVMLNSDAWKDFLQRFTGKREVRNYQRREVIMSPPHYEEAMEQMTALNEACARYLDQSGKIPHYLSFRQTIYGDKPLQAIIDKEESLIDDLRNSTENLILGKLMDYPIIKQTSFDFLNNRYIRWTCLIVFPVGLALYAIQLYSRKNIRNDIKTVCKVNNELMNELKRLGMLKPTAN
ncbi:MAG: LptF/LptG family permease [Dysgonamonadaceae bacterium]|jgi:lipopolysaccharide export system permease protein|nr:LptF/LptG family permease [Dysgonamonadaceae bacterium]